MNIVEARLIIVEGGLRDAVTVRFVDTLGAVTSYLARGERLRQRMLRAFSYANSAKGLRRWWLNFRTSRIAGLQFLHETGAAALALERLRKAVEAGQEVAIETEEPGRPFRLVRPAELDMLFCTLRHATEVRLAVFRPNSLLASRITPAVLAT